MSRAHRLLDLLQLLRNRRRPVSAHDLAQATGVSLCTIYRDIEGLRAQGADIAGEAGLGYILRPGFVLPPLMFTADEIEALVLGSRFVADRAQGQLADAARSAVAKIGAVLPLPLQSEIDATHLLIGRRPETEVEPRLTQIRDAIHREKKVRIDYVDAYGKPSTRIIWPFALAFFSEALLIVGWCEHRQAFRHFRIDRIQTCEVLDARYVISRSILLARWRASEESGKPCATDTN